MLRMMDGLTEEAQAFARPEAVRAMGELVLVELEANVRFHRDLFPPSLCVSASPPNTHTHTRYSHPCPRQRGLSCVLPDACCVG
jgi:hypothetical protein